MKSQQLLRQFVFGNHHSGAFTAWTRENAERSVMWRIRTANSREPFDEKCVLGIRVVHRVVANGDRGSGEVHHAVHYQSPAVLVKAIPEDLLPGMAPGAILLEHRLFFPCSGNVPKNL